MITRQRDLAHTACIAVALLAAGCVGEPAADTLTRQDSAGVPVVVNAAPGPGTPRLQLSEDPRLVIGDLSMGPAHELFRVSGATMLSDGRIVVANTGTNELRYFDRTGAWEATAGRTGEGPGEMTGLRWVGSFAGDSVLVWDLPQRRFSVFSPDATFSRSFQVPELSPGDQPVGILNDGRPVVLRHELAVRDPDASTGIERRPSTVSVATTTGEAQHDLGPFPGPEMSVVMDDPGPATFGVVFGPRVHAAARGARIAVGTTDAYSIRLYDPVGSVTRVVRQVREPQEVAPGDFERALPEVLRPDAPSTPAKERFAANIEQMPRHQTFPAFGGDGSRVLGFDQAGNLWVQEYEVPWAAHTSWQTFDPEGHLIGRIDLPEGASWLDAGEGWILLEVQDDLGVERVVLYGLEGGSATGAP